MQAGIVGLGRMGARIRERLAGAGYEVIGYDPASASEAASLEQMVERLEPPRLIWVMVPSGAATDQVFASLERLVEPGDLLVDGGNSRFGDSVTRATALAERGVRFLDVGVSGGVHGAEHGFCLMAGGAVEDYARIEPLLTALATPSGAFAHVGPSGAGHYAKMCHNAIEYALMQAYAEGFDLLRQFDEPLDLGQIAELWQQGSIIRSWLLELTAAVLEQDANLEGIAPYVEDSGEGRWAVHEAIERGVPAGTIAHALFRRFESRDEEAYALRLVAAMRHQFGAHGTRAAPDR